MWRCICRERFIHIGYDGFFLSPQPLSRWSIYHTDCFSTLQVEAKLFDNDLAHCWRDCCLEMSWNVSSLEVHHERATSFPITLNIWGRQQLSDELSSSYSATTLEQQHIAFYLLQIHTQHVLSFTCLSIWRDLVQRTLSREQFQCGQSDQPRTTNWQGKFNQKWKSDWHYPCIFQHMLRICH